MLTYVRVPRGANLQSALAFIITIVSGLWGMFSGTKVPGSRLASTTSQLRLLANDFISFLSWRQGTVPGTPMSCVSLSCSYYYYLFSPIKSLHLDQTSEFVLNAPILTLILTRAGKGRDHYSHFTDEKTEGGSGGRPRQTAHQHLGLVPVPGLGCRTALHSCHQQIPAKPYEPSAVPDTGTTEPLSEGQWRGETGCAGGRGHAWRRLTLTLPYLAQVS